MRAHNLALVLQTVANSADRPSRAAIATVTGLTRATVSALVDDLIAGGLLNEHDPAPRTGAGRPAAGLALAPDGPAGLGLEINVDYLAACVVDLTGAVRHRSSRTPTSGRSRPARPSPRSAELAAPGPRGRRRRRTDRSPARPSRCRAWSPDGLVRVAPNLGWQDVDAPALLRAVPALADLPITVDNEANLAALGELRADGGAPTFLYVSGEIGIGAGIVLDGELYRGGRGWSGEIGHVTVFPDGRPCRCGANGCLEQYAGQEGIAGGRRPGGGGARHRAGRRGQPAGHRGDRAGRRLRPGAWAGCAPASRPSCAAGCSPPNSRRSRCAPPPWAPTPPSEARPTPSSERSARTRPVGSATPPDRRQPTELPASPRPAHPDAPGGAGRRVGGLGCG